MAPMALYGARVKVNAYFGSLTYVITFVLLSIGNRYKRRTKRRNSDATPQYTSIPGANIHNGNSSVGCNHHRQPLQTVSLDRHKKQAPKYPPTFCLYCIWLLLYFIRSQPILIPICHKSGHKCHLNMNHPILLTNRK